jgi:Mor family transcriptional regulator
MAHYVYKIINLKNNKEYIGVRSHSNPEYDEYMGSSKILNNLYKIEGLENFKKEILKIFNSRKDAEDYEKILVTEEYCSYPNVYNIYSPKRFNSKNKNNIFCFRKDLWDDYYDEIRNKYLNNINIHELSRMYNCSGKTIDNIVRDLWDLHPKNIIFNEKKKYIHNIKNDIIKYYITNNSIKETADYFSLKSFDIRKVLIDENLIKGKPKKTKINKNIICEDIINKIVYEYEQKTHISSLVKKFNLSKHKIKKILISNGCLLRVGGSPKSSIGWSLEKEITEDYKNMGISGSTLELAKKYKTTPHIVQALLKKNNIEIIKVGKKLHPVHNEAKKITEMYMSGYTVHNISLEFKVGDWIICQILKSNGIKLKKGKKRNEEIWNFSDDIISLYKKNNTINKIAKIYNTSSPVIKNILKNYNII